MIDGLINWWGKRRNRKPKPGGCLACGKCCELFGGHLRASKADLERWRKLGREDLLNRVNRLGWIWTDPQTGRHSGKCPFLQSTGPETATCTIHDIKPDICRDYPTLAHARRCVRGVHIPALWLPVIWGAILDLIGDDPLVPAILGSLPAAF